MVWSIISSKRRKTLSKDASESRLNEVNLLVAWTLVVFYNFVGIADIYSTLLGVHSGVAEEVNPVLRAAMDNIGHGWVAAKLLLQGVISFMVLWFPHRVVLGIFIAAIIFNVGIVINNLQIVYGF
ncbi:MAG: DUF5658 family protein [Amphiplicatus sp.]